MVEAEGTCAIGHSPCSFCQEPWAVVRGVLGHPQRLAMCIRMILPRFGGHPPKGVDGVHGRKSSEAQAA
jgi:hypothetical protein